MLTHRPSHVALHTTQTHTMTQTHTHRYLYPHLTGESSMPTSATSALKKELDAAVRYAAWHCRLQWGARSAWLVRAQPSSYVCEIG